MASRNSLNENVSDSDTWRELCSKFRDIFTKASFEGFPTAFWNFLLDSETQRIASIIAVIMIVYVICKALVKALKSILCCD